MTQPHAASLGQAVALMEGLGRPYALIGGTAVVLRSRPRFTRDVDFIVALALDGLPTLLSVAAAHGFTWDDAEIRAFAPAGLVRLWCPPGRVGGMSVDLLFADDALSESVLARATRLPVLDRQVPVATAEDLILMKLDANRPTDLDDVIALHDVFKDALDLAYLRAWAARMDLVERLKAFVG